MEELRKAVAANAKGISRLTTLLTLIALLSALVFAAVVVGGWLVLQDQADRRRENCTYVARSFDAYTDALASISGASEERVAEFRAAYEPQLARCD